MTNENNDIMRQKFRYFTNFGEKRGFCPFFAPIWRLIVISGYYKGYKRGGVLIRRIIR